MKTFILAEDGRTPVEVPQAEFAAWCVQANGGKYVSVADAEVVPGVRVLTQFLGTDPHGGDKYLFECGIHGGKYDGYVQRYATWHDAHHGHYATVERLKKWIDSESDPIDFIQDIETGLLLRWGFTPTDEGSEYERTIRQCDEVPGMDGLNLVVRPDDGAVCLIEYDESGNTLDTVALNPLKTIGQVMRLVQALKGV